MARDTNRGDRSSRSSGRAGRRGTNYDDYEERRSRNRSARPEAQRSRGGYEDYDSYGGRPVQRDGRYYDGYSYDGRGGYDRQGSYDGRGTYDRRGSYDGRGGYDRQGSYDGPGTYERQGSYDGRGTYDRRGSYDSRREASGRRAPAGRRQGGGTRYGQPVMYKKRKKHRALKFVLELLLVLLVAVGVFAAATLGRIDKKKLGSILQNAGVTSRSGYTTFVLYGVDSREGELTQNCHSDTIMLCSMNRRTKELRLVSVYRDTYLDNTNGEYRKATECYFYGGPERSVNMLNKNLDLDIQDYMAVNFNAVVKVIDLLGGIDLEITPEEMEYINGYCVENEQVTGVGYTPLYESGYVHLDGIQTLAYCRIRYTEGWDYKRTERQRTVLTLVMEKAKKQSVPTLLSIANTMLPSISTSMGTVELLELVAGMGGYTLSDQTGFPFDKAAANLAAGDCVVPVNLAANVTQLHQFLYGESGYIPSDTVQAISSEIANATGIY